MVGGGRVPERFFGLLKDTDDPQVRELQVEYISSVQACTQRQENTLRTRLFCLSSSRREGAIRTPGQQ